jgi:hypothetical protein
MRLNFRLAIVAAALVTLCSVAFGAGTTANVSWTAPTAYVDGTALAASDIASYTVSWAPATGQAGPSGSLKVSPAAGSTAVPTLATVPVACGDVTFTVTVTTTASAHYPNMTSAPSSPVPYATGAQCVPNPPTGVQVN